MIVTLKPGCRIVGFGADNWQVHRHGPDRHTHVVGNATSFEKAFARAMTRGLIEPGRILDLSAFRSLARDASRRFVDAHSIRLAGGYFAHRAGDRWALSRDTGRGRKHSVQAGDAADVAGILAAAAWHWVFRGRREMSVSEVGPHLVSILQQLLDGAVEEGGDDPRMAQMDTKEDQGVVAVAVS